MASRRMMMTSNYRSSIQHLLPRRPMTAQSSANRMIPFPVQELTGGDRSSRDDFTDRLARRIWRSDPNPSSDRHEILLLGLRTSSPSAEPLHARRGSKEKREEAEEEESGGEEEMEEGDDFPLTDEAEEFEFLGTGSECDDDDED